MNFIKQNRFLSFLVIGIVYLIAGILGVLMYNKLNYSWWLSLLVADITSTIITFIFSLLFKNSSVYDPYWSVQPPVILIAYSIGKKMNIYGILVLVVVLFWAIRLTLNWAYTFKNLYHQDWRYTMLKEKTKKLYPIINFIGIHLVPTLVVYGCVLPAVYVIINLVEGNIISYICLFISFCAVIIQGTSDIQMHKYRKNRNGIFNRNGLWKYSRHPNYLGEILMWWGIGLSLVFAAQNMWYFSIGAICNTMLFLFVSIPLADGRQSRKEGFLEYKKQTRMLLPIKK